MGSDSAESVHGMPVSLQLIGRKLEEESLLGITDVILKSISP
jgi:amidase